MASLLLVEDDLLLANLYQKILNINGYDVVVANDAQSALNVLDQNKIDLILMDIMLPGHNGIDVLYELQSFTDWQRIPVILISAHSKDRFGLDDAAWSKYGVKGYFYKPDLNFSALNKKIQDLINSNEDD